MALDDFRLRFLPISHRGIQESEKNWGHITLIWVD
jgi:hypothetical protein